MRRFSILALAAMCLPVICRAQFVTQDEVSPLSGCRTPFTYPDGINVRIAVLANREEDSAGLERAIAKDLSRFKETASVTTGHDSVPKTGQKRPLEFEATVFWTELQMDGKTAAYAAAGFFMEMCATLAGGKGFSTQLLNLDHIEVQPSKEKLLDYIEKNLYDALVAEVRSRRPVTTGTNSGIRSLPGGLQRKYPTVGTELEKSVPIRSDSD